MDTCGFKILFTIIKQLSPQLGGTFRDLYQYVNTLKINDGEPVIDFYLRALNISNEIQLQQDVTGQNNRLIQRIVTLLFNVNA